MWTYRFFFFFLFGFQFVNLCLAQNKTDFEIPLGRYREYLLQNENEVEVRSIIKSFDKSTGKWDDVNYTDTSRSGWKVLDHLRKILKLSKAYCLESSFNKEELLVIINLGLSHWINIDYKNDNWFPNEIVVPSFFLDILILLQNELNEEIENELIHRLSEVEIKGSGVNMVYFADIRLHYGLLINDISIVREAVDKITGKIVMESEGVGIQSDYSYHFHDHRLQMYSYGRGFLSTNARIAWELNGTLFSFTPEKVDLLCKFALEGWQWMARGAYTVPSTMDRASTRKGALREPKQLQIFNFLIETSPIRKSELLETRNSQIDINNFKLNGSKNFFKSDILVSHTPDASIFIKTLSERTLPSQSLNSENLKGRFLNAGNTYFMKDGNEYYNLLGNWDWSLLPGFTYVEGASRIKRKLFTGALEYSKYSVSVMNFELLNSNKKQIYKTRKTWFVIDNQVMVSLTSPNGSNIESKTSMDQSRWKGEVEGSFIKSGISGRELYSTKEPFYIYHNGWAYISHSSIQINLNLEEKDSNWSGINARYTKQKESEDRVFKPVLISHGEAVEYAVAPVNSAEEAQLLFRNKTWEVNLNTNDAQVITLQNGVIMAALYKKNNEVRLKSDIVVSSNQPVLLILEGDKIKVTNLNPGIKIVQLTLNSKKFEIKLDTIEGTVVNIAM